MRLEIARGCANVHPVGSLRDVCEERFAILQQLRKEPVFEGMIYALRNKVEHFRFQDVGTGINVLASRFVGLGFLEKTPDVPPFIDGSSIGPKLSPDGTVIGETRAFKTADSIYLTMRFHDSPKGLVAAIVINDPKDHLLYREERPMNGAKVVTFTVPPKKFKPGKYRVKGYWGGNVAVEYEVRVES